MESIETLNQRLIDHFGLDSDTGRPMFRITWANDELEKRLVDHLPTGVALLYPEVIEVKKYPYLKDLYVLEQLVVVPDFQQKELPVSKLSYEPVWAYCSESRQPVPPIWNATKFIIDCMYAAMGKKSMRKYIDDEKNTTIEGREQRVTELAEELFGDESGLFGKTVPEVGEGIIVPSTYEKGE